MAAFVRRSCCAFGIYSRAFYKSRPEAFISSVRSLHQISSEKPILQLLNKNINSRATEQIRHFAEGNVSVEQIQERVLKVCTQFDKIPTIKLKLDSHFMNDLGLDSLDHVEIIMAMEDEFGFEIPDVDAEKLLKPADIVRYVADREDVYD